MEKNGSPEPFFETDDNLAYFLATIPIHILSDGFVKIIRETYTEETLQEIIMKQFWMIYHFSLNEKSNSAQHAGLSHSLYPDRTGCHAFCNKISRVNLNNRNCYLYFIIELYQKKAKVAATWPGLDRPRRALAER